MSETQETGRPQGGKLGQWFGWRLIPKATCPTKPHQCGEFVAFILPRLTSISASVHSGPWEPNRVRIQYV